MLKTMVRLLICAALLALFTCTGKRQTKERLAIALLPDSATYTSSGSERFPRLDTKPASALLPEQDVRRTPTRKSPSDNPNIANDLQIKAILNGFDTKPFQEYQIDGSKDTALYLQEGTIIEIPSKAFAIKKNGRMPKGKVTFKIKEYYSLSDILLANLTTTTKTAILETGGMIYMTAYAGTDILALTKDVEIHFPFKNMIEGMQLFTGQRDASNIVMWESFAEELEETDEVNFADVIAEEMPGFPGGYESFINFLRKNTKYPSEARKKGQEGTVYVNLTIDANGAVAEKTILKGLNESLNQAALSAFDNMPTWKPGKIAGKNTSVKMVFPITFRLDGITFTSPSQPGTTYNEDLRKDFENSLSDSVLQNSDANTVSHFIMRSSKLGWINCDRFITKTPQTNFRVFIGEENNADVKVIFDNYKSVLPGRYVEGYYQFANVPVGEPVTILAIRAGNEHLMLAINKTIINSSTYSALNFKQVTVEALKQEMQKLNQSTTQKSMRN
jgi:TonB family protein